MDICKNVNFTGGNEGKNAKLVFIILQTTFVVSRPNFTAFAAKEGKLWQF